MELQSAVAERCERFAIRAISAAVVWNYFIAIRRLSKHFVARTRDIAWCSFYYFLLPRTFCTTDSISSAVRNPLHCGRMRNFRSVFELELRHDFYRSLINALILNIIHEELQYPSGILPIVSYHRIEYIQFNLPFILSVFSSFHFSSLQYYSIIMPVKWQFSEQSFL